MGRNLDTKSVIDHFRRDISFDLIVFGIICVTLSFALVHFDVFDRWYYFTRAHEEWELDELVIVVIALMSAGSFMAIRHTFHLDRMFKKLAATEEILKEERKIKAQNDRLASVGEIAGGMAHEINNALQPAIGMSDILKRRLEGQDPKLTEYVNMIYESSLQARNIVQNVLAFARGRYMDMHFVEIRPAFENALEMSMQILPEGVILKANLDPAYVPQKTPYILINETGLSQILSNLFKNAADAMKDKGIITLTLSYEEHDAQKAEMHGIPPGLYAKVEVRDNGPGIPENVMKRIFDPFFTTKSVDKGTGLGLSTSFGLMRQFGGTIYAVETSHFSGACFHLLFPVLDEEQRPEETDEKEEDLLLA